MEDPQDPFAFDEVLMNLTNDNPVGCFQVAACLGVIASLLVVHFPSPQSRPQEEGQEERLGGVRHGSSEMLKGKGRHADGHLDLVVVTLGLLCNLVEKDEGNRQTLRQNSSKGNMKLKI
ncbi:unnamed protein product [Sphagnum jensenii]|uniref:Uncharacterized protein n=1 Tax=Sphagnum jensenii TaxID=128206 RepID=A0ABP1AMA7_9BRYO